MPALQGPGENAKRLAPSPLYDLDSVTLAEVFNAAFELVDEDDLDQSSNLTILARKVSRSVTNDGTVLRYFFPDGSVLEDGVMR